MLTAALEHYRQQQRVAALALREVRRSGNTDLIQTAQIIGAYQTASVTLTLGATPAELAEQAIKAPAEGVVVVEAMLTAPQSVIDRLEKADSYAMFETIVASLIADAGRTAAVVDIGRRPAVTGYVRSLNLPSCGRCAVLAGRVYRFSTGFLRHPNCDCLMTPTTQELGAELVLDPTDAITNAQVTGLSSGDLAALEAGADLGQVVNVRKKAAGLTVGSSVTARAGRLTPQGIQRAASGPDEAVELLRRHGYIR